MREQGTSVATVCGCVAPPYVIALVSPIFFVRDHAPILLQEFAEERRRKAAEKKAKALKEGSDDLLPALVQQRMRELGIIPLGMCACHVDPLARKAIFSTFVRARAWFLLNKKL